MLLLVNVPIEQRARQCEQPGRVLETFLASVERHVECRSAEGRLALVWCAFVRVGLNPGTDRLTGPVTIATSQPAMQAKHHNLTSPNSHGNKSGNGGPLLPHQSSAAFHFGHVYLSSICGMWVCLRLQSGHDFTCPPAYLSYSFITELGLCLFCSRRY